MKIFDKFDELKSAVFDSSSLIYLDEINVLKILIKHLNIMTIQEVIEETGIYKFNFSIIDVKNTENLTVDKKLFKCAQEFKLPVISEDKKILTEAEKNKMDYYNSFMLLLFLRYKKIIDDKHFRGYRKRLLKTAWYSDKVVSYGDNLYEEIIKL